MRYSPNGEEETKNGWLGGWHYRRYPIPLMGIKQQSEQFNGFWFVAILANRGGLFSGEGRRSPCKGAERIQDRNREHGFVITVATLFAIKHARLHRATLHDDGQTVGDIVDERETALFAERERIAIIIVSEQIRYRPAQGFGTIAKHIAIPKGARGGAETGEDCAIGQIDQRNIIRPIGGCAAKRAKRQPQWP